MVKGRKSAALTGIVQASLSIEDLYELGEFVINHLVRCGYLRKKKDGSYEACQ